MSKEKPIKIDLSGKEKYYKTAVSEKKFIKSVKKDQNEAVELLNEAFKKIEIHDAIVKTMFVPPAVMNLLPCLTMSSGERILSKTPYGLKFWTADVIVDDHIPHIELLSEEQPKNIDPIFKIILPDKENKK